jgi:hypothetical protein
VVVISSFWLLVVFIGGFALLGAIIYAWSRNRRSSPREVERTEQATRELYDGDPTDRTRG